MHVTACLAGEQVDVEVGEECRTLQALREAIVEALPKLCVEGFDVCVGGRALDDDEGVVSLQDGLALDVVPNVRGLSVLALRGDGYAVDTQELNYAAQDNDVALSTLLLDAGVPVDGEYGGNTPLQYACWRGQLEVATLLLDRGAEIDALNHCGNAPLLLACVRGHLSVVKLLLDRGSAAINKPNGEGNPPLVLACRGGDLELIELLLERGCDPDQLKKHGTSGCSEEALEFLKERTAALYPERGEH